MRTSDGPVVAQALEIEMKKKVLIFGGIAAATLLVGGWALAQSAGHGPGGMHGMGMRGQMGPGRMSMMGMGHASPDRPRNAGSNGPRHDGDDGGQRDRG